MNQFGDLYSKYYELLYRDKDYQGEVNYILKLIREINPNASTLLDMGCGTGRHDELFCNAGMNVHGIDISSEMLKIAECKKTGLENRLQFTQANIVNANLQKKFDAVVSLFHVMSYQNSNEELEGAFCTANRHLEKGGLFIFDFWYGPAVLTDLPITRIKRLEDESVKVTRIVESQMRPRENIVDVHYTLFIKNKMTESIVEKSEDHHMRYLFDTELEMICQKTGFTVEVKNTWMKDESPAFGSWNVVWVIKKR